MVVEYLLPSPPALHPRLAAHTAFNPPHTMCYEYPCSAHSSCLVAVKMFRCFKNILHFNSIFGPEFQCTSHPTVLPVTSLLMNKVCTTSLPQPMLNSHWEKDRFSPNLFKEIFTKNPQVPLLSPGLVRLQAPPREARGCTISPQGISLLPRSSPVQYFNLCKPLPCVTLVGCQSPIDHQPAAN